MLTLDRRGFFCTCFFTSRTDDTSKSSHESFAQRASSKAAAVSQNLRRRWSNLDSVASDLNTTLTDTLTQNNANISDIADNAHLNQTILADMYSQLVNLIRQMNVNDAYIILNGPGRENEPAKTACAALYLRTNAPTTIIPRIATCCCASALPPSAAHTIWRWTATGSPASYPVSALTRDFFDQPYNAYLHSQGTANTGPSDWGYWCMGEQAL